jgi:hypothetical protein
MGKLSQQNNNETYKVSMFFGKSTFSSVVEFNLESLISLY